MIYCENLSCNRGSFKVQTNCCVTSNVLRRAQAISTPRSYGEGQARFVHDEVRAIYLYLECATRVRITTSVKVRFTDKRYEIIKYLHVIQPQVQLPIFRVVQCQSSFDVKVSTTISIYDRKVARLED